MTIHRFNRRLRGRTARLGRTDGPVASSFIDKAEAVGDYPYFIGTKPHPGALALISIPWAFPFEIVDAAEGNIKQFIYSREGKNGEVTGLLHSAAGAKQAAHLAVKHGMAEEIFVLSGRIQSENGQVFEEGGIACFPSAARRPALRAMQDAEILHAVLVD